MSELRADTLSPIDAATLWPQLHRLSTEVIATRTGEHLLVTSGLAAMGLTRLPRVPRTVVVGVKRGLGYRGVGVARELAGGAGWEIVSLRLLRDIDEEALTGLLSGTMRDVTRSGARTLYLRVSEGSPHNTVIRRSGFMPYTLEYLHALPHSDRPAGEQRFRPATRADRHGIFRLYCRAVPEHVRRQEAPTQQDWRSVLDSYDCESEYVLDGEGALQAWVGMGSREARVLVDSPHPDANDEALNLIEVHLGANGTLVLAEHQVALQRLAAERGYTQLGTRLMCARRLAILNPLKEASTVPVIDTVPQAQ